MDSNQFTTFLAETKVHLEKVVKETVNGKIDNLHREVIRLDREQGKKIEEIVKNTKDVVDLYATSGKVVGAIILISKFVAALATVVATIWVFIKFVVLSALPKP